MDNLSKKNFKKLAKAGRIRQGSGKKAPGEDRCETPFEHGIANGFALADISHFYVHSERSTRMENDDSDDALSKSEIIDAAYKQFVDDVAHFSLTLLKAAHGASKAATGNDGHPAPETTDPMQSVGEFLDWPQPEAPEQATPPQGA